METWIAFLSGATIALISGWVSNHYNLKAIEKKHNLEMDSQVISLQRNLVTTAKVEAFTKCHNLVQDLAIETGQIIKASKLNLTPFADYTQLKRYLHGIEDVENFFRDNSLHLLLGLAKTDLLCEYFDFSGSLDSIQKFKGDSWEEFNSTLLGIFKANYEFCIQFQDYINEELNQ